MWRSLLDEFNDTGAIPDEYQVVERGGDVPHIRCSCGRVVAADMMTLTDVGYVCDGCVSRIGRERGLNRRQMVDVLGGPREKSPKPTRPYGGGRKALDVSEG